MKIRLGISCGDLHGIGMEVALKALQHVDTDVDVQLFAPAESLKLYSNEGFGRFGLVDIGPLTETIQLGMPTPESARWAIRSLGAVTDRILTGDLDAMVTAPIDKHSMHAQGFAFPGHTEYLADLVGNPPHLMLLVSDNLRIGTITGHIPISEVSGQLASELVAEKVEVLNDSLRKDMGLMNPRIALLGLNPHAGDNGRIGLEDKEMLVPTVARLQAKGVEIEGPFPADGFFGSRQYQQFDAILSTYHDQGLVPFKLLSFGKGVNFTAGLPFIRTSPDHGTAFGIAGKGAADAGSFLAAVRLAADLVRRQRSIR